MKISIVSTMYMSEKYLHAFYQRISQSVMKITNEYEIVLVNDGSPDKSLDIALKFFKENDKVKVVDLSRNFGHHKAVMAGLQHAVGEKVFLIDCDLEEAPELIFDFYEEFNKKNGAVDSVFGVQELRKGSWIQKVGGGVFYKMFNLFSGVNLEANPLTVRMMSRRYVNAVLLHQETELFMAGILHITGFLQKSITVKKDYKGESAYSFRHRVSLMVKGVTAFSSYPLKFIFYIGILMSISAFLLGTFLFMKKVFLNGQIEPGWTSLMVSIWFIGGLLLAGLGTVGIYLNKVYNEVKRRPLYIVRDFYKK
ncbi:glycosyltransferase family 2 protein [Litorilituus lipolyticus]|uniref:Glycosyltransferase n=1 Tax=Litorilituus lipolyticus TaxID=2491017 RepID=A0A502L3U0_9GAMM|nr:glycosyltransferase family 2 protein [Litorilituus lipolyticus]TPH17055.1 glycosyltransferase [Litorilituus lipolyticus]